jgi:hypothetical protein
MSDTKKIGSWAISGHDKSTVAVQGDEDELARLQVHDDGMSIDSGEGLFIPDAVLVEWLRRRGWVVERCP